MNSIAIEIGTFNITWYAIFIVTGIIIGYILATKEVRRQNFNFKLFEDFAFGVVILGIIGARIWYVLFDLSLYADNPLQIFAIWNGGLAIHGAITAGLLFTLYFTRKHKLNFLQLTDILVPGVLIGQAIGRYGNFTNQEAHGPATTEAYLRSLPLPDFVVNGMNIDGTYYIPTFFYESTWNIIGFVLVMLVIRKKYRQKFGTITAFYLIWYGTIRIYIESLRTDALMFGEIKVAQLASVLMVIAGIYILFKLFKKSKKN
ncbi:MAG: prolipoprotein diacylglyceryl transferase [Mycoplasmatales bacterium]